MEKQNIIQTGAIQTDIIQTDINQINIDDKKDPYFFLNLLVYFHVIFFLILI
jgi:hypothetical protein